MANEQYQTDEQTDDTQSGRFLTFPLGKEIFGVEIRHVTEIIGMQPITALPETPDYMKGIINLRGRIIPVIDIRLKFKKNSIEYTDRTCIIVIEEGGLSAGLIVDNVDEVITIHEENIEQPPDLKETEQSKYISGVGKVADQVLLLLDCNHLFKEESECA